MFYIPNEWIICKDNENEVQKIVNFLSQDIVTDEIQKKKEQKLQRLKDLGETIIYNRLKNGEIQLGP